MLDGYPDNYPISIGPQALPLQAGAAVRQSWEVQMSICLRRREFITGLGGAVAWPVLARAQRPAMPVVGFLFVSPPEVAADFPAGFRKGLSEMGYVEGRNLAIEMRSAHNQSVPT